jgi:hypothetical protein
MAKGNGYNLTQKEYAERRGISQQAVAKMLRQGKLDGAYKKEGRFYLINPSKADRILEQFRNPAREMAQSTAAPPPIPAPPLADALDRYPPAGLVDGVISFAEAARREKVARAALLELDLKVKRGELVDKVKVEEAAAKVATLVRAGIEAIPAKIAPRLVNLETAAEAARKLQREVKVVLADLAEEIAKTD